MQIRFSMLFAPENLFAIHAYVASMNASKKIQPDGAVVAEDGHIVAPSPSTFLERPFSMRPRPIQWMRSTYADPIGSNRKPTL